MKNDLSKYLSKLSIVLFAAIIKNNIYKTNIIDSPITIPPYSSSFNEPIVDEGIKDDIIKHEAVAYRNNHIVKYGNDISHYQGEIDFKKFVAHSSFAISDTPTAKARWVLIYIHFQIYSKAYKTNELL